MTVSNRDRLQQLLLDVFLLDPSEFRWDLARADVDTWDSLGTVSLSVGVQEVFGYHMAPAEATGLKSLDDLVALLAARGIALED